MPGVSESRDRDSGLALEEHTDCASHVLVLVQGPQEKQEIIPCMQ